MFDGFKLQIYFIYCQIKKYLFRFFFKAEPYLNYKREISLIMKCQHFFQPVECIFGASALDVRIVSNIFLAENIQSVEKLTYKVKIH